MADNVVMSKSETTKGATEMQYSVTIDIPQGIGAGRIFDTYEGAKEAFEESWRIGTYPTGTVIQMWRDGTVIDTEITKGSYEKYKDDPYVNGKTEGFKKAYEAEMNRADAFEGLV
jgi:hypothetical protein